MLEDFTKSIGSKEVPAPTRTWGRFLGPFVNDHKRLDTFTEGPDYPYPEGQFRHSGKSIKSTTMTRRRIIMGLRLVSGKVVRRKRDESFDLLLFLSPVPSHPF